MRTYNSQRPPEQTPSDWEAQTKEKIRNPTITLCSFGRELLNILGHLTATVQRETHSKTAVVLVQSNNPVDILLGTDFQPYFGLMFLKTVPNGQAEGMLGGQRWTLEQEVAGAGGTGVGGTGAGGAGVGGVGESGAGESDAGEGGTGSGGLGGDRREEVLNVQPLCFPANHARMVRAAVDRLLSGAVRMFEPSGDLTKTGLSMEEGIVELDGNSVVTLMVQNQSPGPVYLPGEQVLGKLQVVTVLPDCRMVWLGMGLEKW